MADKPGKVIVRFPPSPSGDLHIGNMRTMLFNYLYARKNNGEIFLRFEDTDRERSDVKYEQSAIEVFKTLGVTYDHGPFRQSERGALYSEKLRELLDKGLAYEAEDSEHEPGKKVIRFKNPNKAVVFNDVVRGPISIDSTQFEDFVIARSIDNAIYHFGVVVDDIDMGVTHIMRGEDHITSTPRQILLIEALGGKVPTYAHLPLIVGADKKKLSKRHGATSVKGFLELGYLPETIVNYLAFLGWNPGDEREFFTLDELVKEFSMEQIGKSAATFDYNKIDSINKHYILKLSDAEYRSYVDKFLPEEVKTQFAANPALADRLIDKVIKERIMKFSDLTTMHEAGELAYYFARPTWGADGSDVELLKFKDDTEEKRKEMLKAVHEKLTAIADADWTIDGIKSAIWDWSATVGRGSVLHPMRTSLSGKKQSPDPMTLAYVLGKAETLARIEACL